MILQGFGRSVPLPKDAWLHALQALAAGSDVGPKGGGGGGKEAAQDATEVTTAALEKVHFPVFDPSVALSPHEFAVCCPCCGAS